MTDVSLSTITLSAHIKRQQLSEWIKKTKPEYMLFYKNPFQI